MAPRHHVQCPQQKYEQKRAPSPLRVVHSGADADLFRFLPVFFFFFVFDDIPTAVLPALATPDTV
jgi:hypothetical protein